MSELTQNPLGRPFEILLVEDNYGDVLLTQEAFKSTRANSRLTVARDGEEAMAMLKKQPPFHGQPRPDLILLDLNLPRKDGRELLSEIKSTAGLERIPVIVLTSSRAEMDVQKSYELKANCYIPKPVDFERLKEVVKSLENFWFSVALLPHANREDL